MKKLSPAQQKALAVLREQGNRFLCVDPWSQRETPYYFDTNKLRHFQVRTVDALVAAGVAQAALRERGVFVRDREVVAVHPNPGSDAALDLGCTCAVLDNRHGRGAFDHPPGPDGKPVFWITEDCPLHGSDSVRPTSGA